VREGQVFGNYRLAMKVRLGSTAEVWFGAERGPELGRAIALKIQHAHLAARDASREEFAAEAKLSMSCSQLGLPRAFDVGLVEGRMFFAMEAIQGESVAALAWRGFKSQKPLPIALALKIGIDACSALELAHSAVGPDNKPLEIVHAGIRSHDLLVDYQGQTHLIDFGDAQSAERPWRSGEELVIGKLAYWSPEQWRGEPVSRQTDVFSLGVVLYELLTGRRLFKNAALHVIGDMITRRSIPPPSMVNERLSAEVDAPILHALDKNPAWRHPGPAELRAELESAAQALGEPASTRDLEAYMRDLFQNEIRRKARVLEEALHSIADGRATPTSDFESEARLPLEWKVR
jgi:serine/threonine-protein kinase